MRVLCMQFKWLLDKTCFLCGNCNSRAETVPIAMVRLRRFGTGSSGSCARGRTNWWLAKWRGTSNHMSVWILVGERNAIHIQGNESVLVIHFYYDVVEAIEVCADTFGNSCLFHEAGLRLVEKMMLESVVCLGWLHEIGGSVDKSTTQMDGCFRNATE